MNDFDSAFYKIVGRKIRDIRSQKNVTLSELADKVDVTTKTIQRYEVGDRKIQPARLDLILQALGVDRDIFMREVQAEQFPDSKNELDVFSDDELNEKLRSRPLLRELFEALSNLDDAGLETFIRLSGMLGNGPDK